MKKYSLVILLAIILITAVLSSCEPSDNSVVYAPPPSDFNVPIGANQYYGLSSDNYEVGAECKLNLTCTIDGKRRDIKFNAIRPIDFEHTKLAAIDLTNDGNKEILLEISTKTDSAGVSLEKELFILDGQSDTLIHLDNPREAINNTVKFDCDEKCYYVNTSNKTYKVEKNAFSYLPTEAFAQNLRIEGVEHWGIDRENRFYYNIPCVLTTPEYEEQQDAGAVYVYFKFEDNKLCVDSIEFFTSGYAEKIIDFETNSDDWKLWYNTNHLVLESTSGKRFHFGDTRGDEGSSNNIPDENNIQFYPDENQDAKAIINGDYAAIIFSSVVFTASEPENDRIIIVDLNSGLIVETIFTNYVKILDYNEVDKSVIENYLDTDITPIQYFITADVDMQDTGFACKFKLESFDKKLNYEYPVTYNTKEAQ